VLSGGSTMFQGFGDRLLIEVNHLANKVNKYRYIKKCGMWALVSWIIYHRDYDYALIQIISLLFFFQMKRLAPKDVKVRILAPQERIISTWIGGSILASLDTFRKIWVTKQQYDAIGKGIISRKTF
jgi:actin-related protein